MTYWWNKVKPLENELKPKVADSGINEPDNYSSVASMHWAQSSYKNHSQALTTDSSNSMFSYRGAIEPNSNLRATSEDESL